MGDRLPGEEPPAGLSCPRAWNPFHTLRSGWSAWYHGDRKANAMIDASFEHW